MKQKYILIIILIFILTGVGYYFVQTNEPKRIEVANNELRTFSHNELGLEFSYRVGSNGYVLEESMPGNPSTSTTLLRTFTLFRTEDDKNRDKIPEGGEGPPVIVIRVLNNFNNIEPQMWAEENVFYSNINLKQGAVSQATIGGAKAVRYMADGLYASDNAVITHGENVYVITGQFMDENSDIRRDFSSILNSIRFIQK